VGDESIWKKEISFRKKPKEQTAPPPPGEESTSVWKKEISFGKKKKDEKAEDVAAPERAREETPKQSIWKKEISLGKKRDTSEDVAAPEPAREEPKKQSIWKKEISFGKRKQEDDEAPPSEPMLEPVPIAEATSDPSIAPEPPLAPVDLPPAVAAVLAPATPVSVETPEAPAESAQVFEAPDLEHEPLDVPPAVAKILGAAATEEAAQLPPVVPEPAPVVEPPIALPEPEPTPVFRPQLSDESAAPPDPPASPPLHVEPAAPSYPEPQPVEPPPVAPPLDLPPAATLPPTTIVPSASEPAPAAVPVPPVPAPFPAEPEPVVVHPPVPAAELPPEETTESVPFWKRDISFGKKKEMSTAPEAAPEEKTESVPFWKRDVSIGKKKEADGAPTAKKTKEPRAPKVKVDRGGKGKKIVGLKIGASQLAAARVTNNGSAELLQVAREPLSPGVIVGGELRDPDALGLALKDFFTKHKLPKRGVRLGIANNRIGVRTFDVDGIDDPKQLDNAIRFRAQEALPIPIDEAVMDYQVLGESVNDEGQTSRRILLVVAYREQIDRYMEACKKAGIILSGIDLEAFALLRALQAPQSGVGDDPDAALVAVAIGHERSTFAVSDGRVCEFTRVLEWGGAALNVALARTLESAPSEVENIKRALSLMDEMTPEGLTPEQAAKARDAIRRSIQIFARELVSSLQFYQNQPGSLGIGEIVLTGGTTHLPGLAAELEKLIGVRVRVGDPLARIKMSKKLGQPEQVGSLAVAIGLGIED